MPQQRISFNVPNGHDTEIVVLKPVCIQMSKI